MLEMNSPAEKQTYNFEINQRVEIIFRNVFVKKLFFGGLSVLDQYQFFVSIRDKSILIYKMIFSADQYLFILKGQIPSNLIKLFYKKALKKYMVILNQLKKKKIKKSFQILASQ